MAFNRTKGTGQPRRAALRSNSIDPSARGLAVDWNCREAARCRSVALGALSKKARRGDVSTVQIGGQLSQWTHGMVITPLPLSHHGSLIVGASRAVVRWTILGVRDLTHRGNWAFGSGGTTLTLWPEPKPSLIPNARAQQVIIILRPFSSQPEARTRVGHIIGHELAAASPWASSLDQREQIDAPGQQHGSESGNCARGGTPMLPF